MKKIIVTIFVILLAPLAAARAADLDGDSRSDFGIFRASSGLWSARDVTRIYFGSSGDTIIPGDYDGDGKDDVAVFRPSSGLWAVRGVTRVYFGKSGDIPVGGGGSQRLYDYVVKAGDGADLVRALESNTYRSVFVPAGTYNVSEIIRVDNVRLIDGEGYSSRINFTAEGYYLNIVENHCLAQNLRVDGGGDSSGYFPNIYINGADFVTLRNCYSTNSHKYGFGIDETSEYCSLFNCVAEDATSGFYQYDQQAIWGDTSRFSACAAIGCSNIGFVQCFNLHNCYVDGQNTTGNGYYWCGLLTACEAHDCTDNGFNVCWDMSSCYVYGNSHTFYGLYLCETFAACAVEGTTDLEYAACSNYCTASCF